jgi:hypothetical protein
VTPRDSLPGQIFDADLLAVLDAVGFVRAALVAHAPAGSRAVHFSVTHVERVTALVLVDSYAHYVRDDDYPWAFLARISTGSSPTVITPWRFSVMGSGPGTPQHRRSRRLAARAVSRLPQVSPVPTPL